MKNVIFLTCWLCFASMQNAYSQEITTLQDTLIINLEGQNQLHITGNKLIEIAKYKDADSIKNLFINDLQQAYLTKTISDESRMIHYLIGKNGQRRLKAASDPATEEPFNFENEVKRLEQNLPVYQFIIYDLKNGYQLHLFLENIENLENFKQLNIESVQNEIFENKKDYVNKYKVNFSQVNDSNQVISKHGRINLEFLTFISFGATLFGNTPAPAQASNFELIFSNKYKKPVFKLGSQLGYAFFADYKDFKFHEISAVNYWDFYFGFNFQDKQATFFKPAQWYSFSMGFIPNYYQPMYSHQNIFPKNAFKISVMGEIGKTNIQFGSIYLTDRNFLNYFSVLIPF